MDIVVRLTKPNFLECERWEKNQSNTTPDKINYNCQSGEIELVLFIKTAPGKFLMPSWLGYRQTKFSIRTSKRV